MTTKPRQMLPWKKRSEFVEYMQNKYFYKSEELIIVSENPNKFKQIMDELDAYESSSVSYEQWVLVHWNYVSVT